TAVPLDPAVAAVVNPPGTPYELRGFHRAAVLLALVVHRTEAVGVLAQVVAAVDNARRWRLTFLPAAPCWSIHIRPASAALVMKRAQAGRLMRAGASGPFTDSLAHFLTLRRSGR